jgi:ABC-type transport system involved in cytochrome c biogenesis permease component
MTRTLWQSLRRVACAIALPPAAWLLLAALDAYVPMLKNYLVVPELAMMLIACVAGLVVLVKGRSLWLGVLLACIYLPVMYFAVLYLEAWAGGVMRGTAF